MSNMSYCRFQNTVSDLDDCFYALQDMIVNGDGKLSREELDAAKRLVEMCCDVVSLVSDRSGLDVDEILDEDHRLAKFLSDANDEAEEEN